MAAIPSRGLFIWLMEVTSFRVSAPSYHPLRHPATTSEPASRLTSPDCTRPGSRPPTSTWAISARPVAILYGCLRDGPYVAKNPPIHLAPPAPQCLGAAAAAPPVSSAPQPRTMRSPGRSRALAAGGVLAWWSFGFTTMMGSDLWWHLAAGRWILADGDPQLRDPWSFTAQGQPWLNPEWLSDLIFMPGRAGLA